MKQGACLNPLHIRHLFEVKGNQGLIEGFWTWQVRCGRSSAERYQLRVTGPGDERCSFALKMTFPYLSLPAQPVKRDLIEVAAKSGTVSRVCGVHGCQDRGRWAQGKRAILGARAVMWTAWLTLCHLEDETCFLCIVSSVFKQDGWSKLPRWVHKSRCLICW